MKCDFCDRERTGYVTYRGMHAVCEEHRTILLKLAGQRLTAAEFLDELKKMRGEL